MTMTPEQIASAWALVNAATEGPWGWREDPYAYDGAMEMVCLSDATDDMPRILDDGSAGGEYSAVIDARGPDADFIAASRELVPQLLATLEAERAKVARLVAGLKQIAEMEVFSMGIGIDPRPTQEAKIARALLNRNLELTVRKGAKK